MNFTMPWLDPNNPDLNGYDPNNFSFSPYTIPTLTPFPTVPDVPTVGVPGTTFTAPTSPVDTNPWMPSNPTTFDPSNVPIDGVFPITPTTLPGNEYNPSNPNPGGVANPFGQGYDPLNLPMWNGPYAAPITEGMFDAVNGIKKSMNPQGVQQSQDVMSAIMRAINGDGFHPQNMDANSIIAAFKPNTGNTQTLEEASKTGFQTMSGYDPTNTAKSNSVIDSILNGTANNNVDPNMKSLQGGMLSALLAALKGPSFDNTEMFKNMDKVFEDQLGQQTADLNEQYSGLGLGVGSTDRLKGISSNAGEARAKFQIGKAQIAQKSFEDSQNRVISALSQGASVADVLNSGVKNAAAMLPAIMENEQIPFKEKMTFAATVLNPAADRRLEAAKTGASLDEAAMQRYADEQKVAAQTRLAGIDAATQSRGQDISVAELAQRGALNNFNAEAMLRAAADDEVKRQQAEFARTQGGGFDQIIKLIQSIPELATSVGPSTASQGADVIGNIIKGLAAAGVI